LRKMPRKACSGWFGVVEDDDTIVIRKRAQPSNMLSGYPWWYLSWAPEAYDTQPWHSLAKVFHTRDDFGIEKTRVTVGKPPCVCKREFSFQFDTT